MKPLQLATATAYWFADKAAERISAAYQDG